jgi:hypothetical protein
MIRGDAFQTTNRNGLFLNATSSASGLARAVTNAAEDTGEHVRIAILHVGIAEPPLGDHSYIFRYVSVGRTAPLAIDDLVKIVGL